MLVFAAVCLRFDLRNSMWKLLPDPEGPKQKKFELSVSLFFPSFTVMSIATGTL